MTYAEINAMVDSIGLPYSYYQFPEGTEQTPPFVVFFYSRNDDLYADQTNYQKIVTLNIELYTADEMSTADLGYMDTIEGILNNAGLTYYKEQNHIDSEKMWQTAYEMEVIINEQQG